MKRSDLPPGTRYTRPNAFRHDRELIAVAHRSMFEDSLYPYYGFDPKTGELVGGRDNPVMVVETQRSPNGTANHVSLTDDEVRVLEFALGQIASGDAGEVFEGPRDSAWDKLRAFGLTRERSPGHIALGGVTYKAVERGSVLPDFGGCAVLLVKVTE